MYLIKIWTIISNTGIGDGIDKVVALKFRLLNQYHFILALVFIINGLRDWYFGGVQYFIILFLIGMGLLTILFFVDINVRTRPNALFAILILCSTLIFYFSSTSDLENGLILYYIGILCITLFVFHEPDLKWYGIFIYILVFIYFSIGHYYDFRLFRGAENLNDISYVRSQRMFAFLEMFISIGLYGNFIRTKTRMISRYYELSLLRETIISELKKKTEHTVNSSVEELVKLAVEDDIAFVPSFKQLFISFHNNLMMLNSEMTGEEFKLCALLKLGFSTKDIAECCHLAVRTVQTKKNRLRKSFSIPSDEDLYLWVEKIED